MIKVNIHKPMKYMGKLKECTNNTKILCVCKPEDCLEKKVEKVEKK